MKEIITEELIAQIMKEVLQLRAENELQKGIIQQLVECSLGSDAASPLREFYPLMHDNAYRELLLIHS